MSSTAENVTALNEPLYALYSGAGPSWALIACAVSLCAVAVPGLVMNAGVIWTSWRNSSLHGTVNYLLALTCLAEMLHQSVHLLFLCVTLSGQNFIDYQLAVQLTLPCIFSVNVIFPLMLFTGLDRLICVLFPIQSSKMSRTFKRTYLTALTLICCAFSLINMVGVYSAVGANAHLKITGSVVELILADTYAPIGITITLSILVLIVVFYLLVGAFIKLGKKTNQNSSNLRIYRALCIIITANVGGYLVAVAYLQCITHIQTPANAVQIWFVSQAMSGLVGLSAGSNGPILWTNSSEYRHAFKRELDALKKRLGCKSSAIVVPMPVQAMQSTT